MPDYPRPLDFEAHGNRRGLSYRAGSFYLIDGKLTLMAYSEKAEKHLIEVFAMYDAFLVGAAIPEAVLLREAPSYPTVQEEHPGQPPGEVLAFLKPPDTRPMSTEAAGFAVSGHNVENVNG